MPINIQVLTFGKGNRRFLTLNFSSIDLLFGSISSKPVNSNVISQLKCSFFSNSVKSVISSTFHRLFCYFFNSIIIPINFFLYSADFPLFRNIKIFIFSVAYYKSSFFLIFHYFFNFFFFTSIFLRSLICYLRATISAIPLFFISYESVF